MKSALISISDLKIHCIVGIYPHERIEPQDLFLDLELKIDLTAIEHSQNLDDTVDYAALSQQLTLMIQERQFELIENVEVSNRISLYSDYLENPGNIDLDYTINTTMKVNKYLTTNLILQFIYDDNSIKRLQVREVMGIGVNLKI